MRIAEVSPLIESVPPKLYGGTERIVSYLTEELVRQGHDVALFASGDLETAAELEACSPMALRLAEVHDTLPYSVIQLEKVRKRAGDFDIMHFHTEFVHFPILPGLAAPAVTTMHGRLDLPSYPALFSEFPEAALVSVSPTISVSLCWRGGSPRFPTGCRRTFTPFHPTAPADISRSWGGSARKSVSTARLRSPSKPARPSRSRPRSIKSTRPISRR